MRYKYNPYTSSELQRLFPFRQDNRRPDGFWDTEDATRDNIKGTSVDPGEPVWPRWRTTPPLHGEGDFISEHPFSTSTRSRRGLTSIHLADLS